MKKKNLVLLGLGCAAAAVFAAQGRGGAAAEAKPVAGMLGGGWGGWVEAGGGMAIIDFPGLAGLEPVEGVPSNRGGHGIPQKIVVEELSAAGLQVEKIVNDWPEDSYCVLFVKR